MILPAWLFTVALWLAVIGSAAGAGYLIGALVKDWRDKSLW